MQYYIVHDNRGIIFNKIKKNPTLENEVSCARGLSLSYETQEKNAGALEDRWEE